ncbi:cell division protein SepF [Oceanobacillus oncorhynchi subsp. incaldanensis]|uniref:Cell division protein SepF n=2 Tax=Oceanobacillus TaxID=182709 RepID=A0A0A1MMV1_9BACI|nr:cell division protein SepF [Oceanobacillus oncorhynchi]MDM8099179.1 cell division protein SepF [Oceanobacillus oncorhynchi]UUI38682.1 cell division protein SepF [Oceanobacillus oncorhynchi]GIO18300.1 cell division protein SepF [Oceanobacillus oncorhynchi subsp. incaldanensis]CEI84378.1 Cell division protein SepF [Oceanobacillus oncorhynchi]
MSFKKKLKNYFTMDDEYEYEYAEEEQKEEIPQVQEKTAGSKNVVNLSSIQNTNSKVVLAEPRNYNEAQDIADNIVNRRAVIINLQRVDRQQAKRIVDFLSGTVYAVKGDIQKLGSETFLCTPDNVEVSGSISEMLYEQEDYDKGW